MTIPLHISNLSLSLETRKLHLINYLSSSDDEQVIAAIEEVLRQKRITTYENSLRPMNEAQYLAKIGRGIDDINNGRTTSLEDYLKEIAEEK